MHQHQEAPKNDFYNKMEKTYMKYPAKE